MPGRQQSRNLCLLNVPNNVPIIAGVAASDIVIAAIVAALCALSVCRRRQERKATLGSTTGKAPFASHKRQRPLQPLSFNNKMGFSPLGAPFDAWGARSKEAQPLLAGNKRCVASLMCAQLLAAVLVLRMGVNKSDPNKGKPFQIWAP